MDEVELLSFKPSKASELGLYFWGIVLLFGVVTIPVSIILFLVAWVRIASTKYRLTSQRFFKRTGLIARHEEEIELFRVKDIKLNQGIFQRILGIGDVTVVSSDKTAPFLLIHGVRDPEKIKETLRTAYKQARLAEGVRNTELTD